MVFTKSNVSCLFIGRYYYIIVLRSELNHLSNIKEMKTENRK